MPRAPRCRRIQAFPDYWSFAPQDGGQAETITMTLDEYECIRLMDREKLTQEQCAQRMGIARTTVTGIYESAGASWRRRSWTAKRCGSAAAAIS